MSDAKNCPLCGHPVSNCCAQSHASVRDCWCFNGGKAFPDALLDEVPEQLRDKACICQSCVNAFYARFTSDARVS